MRLRRRLLAALVASSAAVPAAHLPAVDAIAATDPGRTELVSPPFYLGEPARGTDPLISDDGRYVVYGSVRRRDMTQPAAIAIGPGGEATVSADGRFVAFTSSDDLDPTTTDTNGTTDVYLWDGVTGTTRLVSRTAAGAAPSQASTDPVISADGSTVLFSSVGQDLADVGVYHPHLFAWRAEIGAVALVSGGAGGATPNGYDGPGGVSGNGDVVAFATTSNNLLAGGSDGNSAPDVYVRDLTTGATTLVSRRADGAAGAGADFAAISRDGNVVVFSAHDPALSPVPDANNAFDVFAFDRSTGTTRHLNPAWSGDRAADRGSAYGSMSADGRWIAVFSGATDVVNGFVDGNDVPPGTIPPADYEASEVYLRDRLTGTAQLVTHTGDSRTSPNRGASEAVVSADGSRVAFTSSATNVVAGLSDTNSSSTEASGEGGQSDVFAFSRAGAEIRAVSVDDDEPFATMWGGSSRPTISADGRFVAFMNVTNSFTWAHSYRRDLSPPPPPPPPGPGPSPAPGEPAPRSGYWMVTSEGHVYAFGDAGWHGNGPAGAIDIEPTPSRNGYWIVDERGQVFTFGDAAYHGGWGGLFGGERVTSISGHPSGVGYWLFTSRGRVRAFGAASHMGDMATTPLNGPVLDSVATPSGHGYYMVASDGGIFTFGDATFRGSMGHVRLNAPVQSLAPDPDGVGYWLVASDGGIFTFETNFYGSMGSTRLNRPVTGMVGAGSGYLMVAEDGGIFTFGTAAFHGSLGNAPPPAPVVAVAAMS